MKRYFYIKPSYTDRIDFHIDSCHSPSKHIELMPPLAAVLALIAGENVRHKGNYMVDMNDIRKIIHYIISCRGLCPLRPTNPAMEGKESSTYSRLFPAVQMW